MSRFESPLNNIRIASPCSANWNEMYGNERMRHCGQCKLNVYNLSGMTRQEAEDLLTNAEGRLCVRFYRRTDGTVLTENCPVGWARVKQRARVYTTAAFSLIMAMLAGLFLVSIFSRQSETTEVGVLAKPTPMPTPDESHVTMGAVAYHPTPTPERKTASLVGIKDGVTRIN
ncbi:MAG TPA: hypothetical protein VEV84_10290 [Pyrinomonadaceae bacterium]|nr:hypothetical protein [Pyrinomonadaceae bacterium]